MKRIEGLGVKLELEDDKDQTVSAVIVAPSGKVLVITDKAKGNQIRSLIKTFMKEEQFVS